MAELRRWTATASLTRPAVLLAILILAAVLRWWGWDYGLPHPMARPDEEITLEAAYQMFASGNPDPVSLPYPSFIVYLDVAALRLYYKVGEFLGRYDRRFDMLFDMVVLRPRFHYRVARTVNLVFGVATVALVYLLATTTFQTRDTGWLAALLLGTSLLHVIYWRCCTARSKSLTSLMPVAESPGAVRIGHPERGHLVEYLAPNSVFNSLPRQRSCSHLRPDDRFVTIDRVLHHASLGEA